jgi:ankyrin repeat protein
MFKQILLSLLLLNSCAFQNIEAFMGDYTETPVTKAAKKNDLKELELLIQQGADLDYETGWDQPHAGQPALSFALRGGHFEAAQMLVNAEADVNKYNDLGSVKDGITIPESLHERNITLLTYVIGRKMPMKFIELLINAKNADVDKKSLCGTITPLMIAAAIGYEQAAKALLKAGADTTIINPNDGKTAIDYARDAGHTSIVKLLMTAY